MATPDPWTILLSAALSFVVSFGVAIWKTNTVREYNRSDELEQWYSQTLTLCSLIRWELMRVDGEIDISSRRGNTSFTDLDLDDPDEAHELHLIDQLVYDLFRHSGSAPYEIQPTDIAQSENTPVDDIRDFVTDYLQIETDATVIDPTVGDVREDWNKHLKELRISCRNEIQEIEQNNSPVRSQTLIDRFR